MSSETTGKLFSEFVKSASKDILAIAEKAEGKVSIEQAQELIKGIVEDLAEGLNENEELAVDHRTFNVVLDVTTQFLFMDNLRLCSQLANNEELMHIKLLGRLDSVWAYFRKAVDEFSVARGLSHHHSQKKNPK